MLVLLSGLVAGAAHVVAGPDHLAAIAPLATDQPGGGARLGLRWGLGHGLGASALGAMAIWGRGLLDIGQISAWAEVIVGLTLVGVGLWTLRRALGAVEAPLRRHRGHHGLTAFGMGLLHGAAGLGHLLVVLPALAMEAGQAWVYLGAYFAAAVATMALFGGLLDRTLAGADPGRARRWTLSTSSIAVLVGLFWVGSALSA